MDVVDCLIVNATVVYCIVCFLSTSYCYYYYSLADSGSSWTVMSSAPVHKYDGAVEVSM